MPFVVGGFSYDYTGADPGGPPGYGCKVGRPIARPWPDPYGSLVYVFPGRRTVGTLWGRSPPRDCYEEQIVGLRPLKTLVNSGPWVQPLRARFLCIQEPTGSNPVDQRALTPGERDSTLRSLLSHRDVAADGLKQPGTRRSCKQENTGPRRGRNRRTELRLRARPPFDRRRSDLPRPRRPRSRMPSGGRPPVPEPSLPASF